MVARPGGSAACQHAALPDRHGSVRRRASSQSQTASAWPRRSTNAGGDVAVVVVADLSRRVRERVPDRRATAILTDGAFDLIGGGSGAPEQSRGKGAQSFAPGRRTVSRPSARRGGGPPRPKA